MTKQRDAAPSVMSVRAGPAPSVTEAGGKVWRLGWNTQDAKAGLEALVVSHATREAVKRMRLVGGEEGAAYFELFQNRVDAGQYSTFAPGWTHTMAGPDASWLFLLSLLQAAHPSATPDDAKRLLKAEPEQTVVSVGVIAPDFFAAVVTQIGVEKGATTEEVAAAAAKIATAVVERMALTAEPVTA